jgi:hypothetical protein
MYRKSILIFQPLKTQKSQKMGSVNSRLRESGEIIGSRRLLTYAAKGMKQAGSPFAETAETAILPSSLRSYV